MRYLQFISLLALTLMWGCGPDSIVDQVEPIDAVAVRTSERPFHLKGSGYQVNATAECEAPGISRASVGSGTGTHIGQFTVEIEECMDPTTGIAIGTAKHTVANGDILFVDYVLQYIPNPADPNAVSAVFIPWTINGELSTGRFAGASGNGTGALTGNLVENWLEWNAEGFIIY